MSASNKDYGRYMRMLAGETADDIAESDGVSIVAVEKSIARGAELENQRVARKVQILRDQGAVEIEEFRKQVRDNLFAEYERALAFLMKGKNVAISTDDDGKVKIEEYTDPKILVAGIREFRKTVSMEEKPAVPTISIQQNVQQNNNTTNVTGEVFDFERSLMRIREKQKAAGPDTFIDVEAHDVTDVPQLPPGPIDEKGLDF